MDVTLKLLLLAALTLLVSAQTPTGYKDLSTTLRKYVDKALEVGNHEFGRIHHVDFDSVIRPYVTKQSSLKVNVLLKVTTCKKAHSFKHLDGCNTQKQKTPLIDCLVCKMKNDTELVHCVKKIDVDNEKAKEIRNNCISYHTGGSTIMGSSMRNTNKLGCLGCIRSCTTRKCNRKRN